MTQKFPTSIRLTVEDKMQLDAIAAREGRSTSNLVAKIISDFLNKHQDGKL